MEGSPDRFVGSVGTNPHEPSFLCSMEDQESSASNTLRDVNVIKGDAPSNANPRDPPHRKATNPVHTPAQHLTAIESLLRESPFDPVLYPFSTSLVGRIRSTR